METKHTKGEWVVNDGNHVIVKNKMGTMLARFSQFTPSGFIGHEEANAKLIAASPDLLEACIIAKIDTEMLLNGSADFTSDNLLATIENLEKAIKKATE